MTNQPKVTIIIPVYNVEPYLRQCLDSIVNQTLREIQIICVNDGSTDGSLAILREYANKDSRIEIIDKPNGGLSSARNAAYPHLKGKYTLFVDSDDWLDLDACRKTYYRAEQSGADMVVFDFALLGKNDELLNYSNHAVFDVVQTTREKCGLLRQIFPCVWSKLCRTDFLLDNNITCPVGLRCEDIVFTFKAILHARKTVSLPVSLYYYRADRTGSITKTKQFQNLYDIIEVFRIARQSLDESRRFSKFKEVYHYLKLTHIHGNYSTISSIKVQREANDKVVNCLNADDLAFLRGENDLSAATRYFYLALLGDKKAKRKVMLRRINQFLRPIMKPIKSFMRKFSGKRDKKLLAMRETQIAQLSKLVTQLCEEVVQLRELANSEHEAYARERGIKYE